MKSRHRFTRLQIIIAVNAVILIAVLIFAFTQNGGNGISPVANTSSSGFHFSPFGIPPAPGPASPMVAKSAAPTPVPPKARTFDDFRKHPFAVAKSSHQFGWTAENGLDPAVIRQLAHNQLELERMTEENRTIKRRQLVYYSQPITDVIQQARAAGQPVQSFTLPGLDGQQYDVEVTQNYVNAATMSGSLAGHLKDSPFSIVSIGFINGYESYDIVSPNDNIYIVADAREPGEFMVKQINPDTYGGPPGVHGSGVIMNKLK